MAEKHGDIDRKEHYFVIKGWQDEDGRNYFITDHDTCEIKFQDGTVWNNKVGEWIRIEKDSLELEIDTALCDELWDKLDMNTSAKKIIMEVQDAIEAAEEN